MNLSNLVALMSLTLSLFGCAVGSEDENLPTPAPAKEFSAPLSPPAINPVETPDNQATYAAQNTIYDVPSQNDLPPFISALHEINKPQNPIPHNGN